MTKYAHFVVGPAGCGKSTFCTLMQQHCEAAKRVVHCINLDPAAEHFRYKCALDVKDLVSVDEVIEETELGPNGGLVYAMEFLTDNLEWLQENLDNFGDDEYFLFDCPGQIELFTHLPVMRQIVDMLQENDFRICVVCCLDVSFLSDPTKFISGSLSALSAMVSLELPHINVLTKCDLVKNEDEVERMVEETPLQLAESASKGLPLKYRRLTSALADLLEEYSMVNFVQLNPKDEDSIGAVLAQIDFAIQWGEDQEPQEIFDDMDREGDFDFEGGFDGGDF